MPRASTRILIIGGYGTFGRRLAQLLAQEPQLSITIAGRSQEKAEAFIAGLEHKAEFVAEHIDRSANIKEKLNALRPHFVIDATGPFQSYRDDPYKVVKAAISCGANYMDLADATAFVDGITKFDADARANGVFILSGVSSCPVLTGAAVRHLANDLASVVSFTAGIAPAPYANVGVNVIRAITSYAGKPIRRLRTGSITTSYGLTESMRYTVRPPGYLPLKNTRFTLVDVPEYEVLPRARPELKSVWMGAGPRPAILHRALTAMAWMVRVGILPTLTPLAPFFHRVINIARWGERRGGMFVEIGGQTRQGTAVTRSWHLIAEGDEGPFIPSMPAAAVVLKCLDGKSPEPGARTAAGELGLSDFQTLFASRNIVTGTREENHKRKQDSLYARVLADAFDTLPDQIKNMHSAPENTNVTVKGRANIVRGQNLIAQLVASIVGFPPAGHDIPVTVTFNCTQRRETWTRTFGAKSFSSTQEEGHGKSEGLIVERFGPVAIALAAVVDEHRLKLIPRRWTFLAIPMPRALMPFGETFEHVENDRFCFHVDIQAPLIGRIVKYTGYLAPVATTPARSSREHTISTTTPDANA